VFTRWLAATPKYLNTNTTEPLQEAELRYRTVADFTYDWEYWENPDGRLHYVSPACQRITGYTTFPPPANASPATRRISSSPTLIFWSTP